MKRPCSLIDLSPLGGIGRWVTVKISWVIGAVSWQVKNLYSIYREDRNQFHHLNTEILS